MAVIGDMLRAALARQISHKYADGERMIPAYVVEVDIEEAIRAAITNICRCGTYPRVRAAILAAAGTTGLAAPPPAAP